MTQIKVNESTNDECHNDFSIRVIRDIHGSTCFHLCHLWHLWIKFLSNTEADFAASYELGR